MLRFAKSTGQASLRATALQLLLLLSEQGPEIVQEFVRQNAVSALLEILKVTQEEHAPGADNLSEAILHTLANICDFDSFRETGGVQVLAAELARQTDAAPLQIAVVNCIWRNVAGHPRNEAIFIDKLDGIFKLLDLFETATLDIKRMTLACLNDLLCNPRAVVQFYAWHSKRTLRGSVTHLLDLWLFEQTRANAVTHHGVIRHVQRPLNPDLAAAAAAATGSSTRDTRSLVYAIFKRLDFRVNESLTVEQATQMPVIRKFPECRQVELWQDMHAQLRSDAAQHTGPANQHITQDDQMWTEAEMQRLQTIVNQAHAEQVAIANQQTSADLAAVKATVDAFLSEKTATLKYR